MDFVRRTAFTNGNELVEDLESSQVRNIYLCLILRRNADFHCHFGFIPFVYQDRRRRGLARVTILPGLVPWNFVAGAIYVCLSRSSQIHGMGLASFNRRLGHDL